MNFFDDLFEKAVSEEEKRELQGLGQTSYIDVKLECLQKMLTFEKTLSDAQRDLFKEINGLSFLYNELCEKRAFRIGYNFAKNNLN